MVEAVIFGVAVVVVVVVAGVVVAAVVVVGTSVVSAAVVGTAIHSLIFRDSRKSRQRHGIKSRARSDVLDEDLVTAKTTERHGSQSTRG